MTTEDPRSLVVLAFDSELKAQEALLAMTRIQAEGIVLLHDAVFIRKDEHGTAHVTETVDISPADAGLQGALWGSLFGTLLGGPIGTVVGGAVSAGIGALAAKLTDIGIPDATVEELKEAITPGYTALALLVSHLREEAFLAELHRFAGARLVRSTLSVGTVRALREALRPDSSSAPSSSTPSSSTPSSSTPSSSSPA